MSQDKSTLDADWSRGSPEPSALAAWHRLWLILLAEPEANVQPLDKDTTRELSGRVADTTNNVQKEP